MFNIKYPFELKNITSIPEYLFVLKNCLRLIQRHGVSRKVKGPYVFLKWLHDKNQWSIEVSHNNNTYTYVKISTKNKGLYDAIHCTSRLIEDIKIIKILEKYHMIKNPNRVLCLVFSNNTLYPIGLFSSNISVINKSKYLLIDDTTIIEDLINVNSSLNSTKLQLKIKNYLNDFNLFVELLNKEFVISDMPGDLLKREYLNLSRQTHNKKLTYRKYSDLIREKSIPDKSQIFYYVIYTITILFTKFLNSKIQADYDLILYDKINRQTIKLPFEFYENRVVTKKLKPPMMPMRF